MKTFATKYIVTAITVFSLSMLCRCYANPGITYLGIEQGLSNNSVRCIYQDRKGFMWFGTYDGLNRYDGYGFKIFRNKFNEPNSLVNNIVSSITEDQHNNLWIGTRQGVSIYNMLMGKFTSLSYSSPNGKIQKISNVVKDVRADGRNNILIGCEGIGLLVAADGDTTAKQVPFVSSGAATNNYGVQAIRVDHQNKIWVLVQNQGLCLLDKGSMKLLLIDSSIRPATCMEIDREKIWMGGSAGVYCYNSATGSSAKVVDVQGDKLSSSLIVALSMDAKNNLWIGTNGGGINIYHTGAKKMEYLPADNKKASISSGSVYSIYKDKEGRTWIGTLRGGVNIIDPKKDRFTTISHDYANANSLPGNFVSTFYEAPDSTIWIGTDGKGLSLWNRKKNLFTNYISSDKPGSLQSNAITSVKADSRNTIWLTSMSGVSRFNAAAGTFEQFKCLNPVSGFENKSSIALYEDSEKNLWLGTLREGSVYGALYLFNYTANRFEAFDTKLSDLFTIYEDRSGVLWGGNLNQLVQIDKVNKHHRFYNFGNTVRCMLDDKKGNFWIGTEGGGLLLFSRRENKITKRYTTDDGLCNNSVLSILQDEKGYLWLSTYNGLSKFNVVENSFSNYYQNDGLQSNEFHFNAALALRSGEFLFGGIRGFTIFHPSNIISVNTVPNLVFTGLTINNQPVERDNSFISIAKEEIEEIQVPYNEAVLSIDFTALEYSSPNKISYAYYLDGWDRSWNYTKTRTANYTHLEEGAYTFRVKSTNAEGIWNTKEISFKIIVWPPWYRTWWAYLLYLCAAGAAIYYYLSYRARQTSLKYEVTIARLNAEMEHAAYEKERAEHEKERIINGQEKELNEKKLSFFTNISHEFRNPLTLIINPVKDLLQKKGEEENQEKAELNVVYRNARRLLSLVDQLLLFRKAESGADKLRISKLNFYDLCKEVYLCFVQQAKAQKIEYLFECANEELLLYADREKMEIILYNLLSNAFKYTNAGGKIKFSITEGEDDVELNIADTGQGIPPEVQNKLFDRFYQVAQSGAPSKPGFGIGLHLVKHFTEEHKGAISYHSVLEKGTVFTLRLLKSKSHFDSHIIVDDTVSPFFLKELVAEDGVVQVAYKSENQIARESGQLDESITEKKSILIVDDDDEIRQYVAKALTDNFLTYQAGSGEEGVKLAKEYLPDIIISDIKMAGLSGIELCRTIKEDASLGHIPVILLTGETSGETRLKGVEGGADDYLTKPFEKELLLARVSNLLKSRNSLQKYFYNEITLSRNNIKVSAEYKEFLEKCIAIVEDHLYDDDFTVKTLAFETGMSHSSLYKKIKSVSGQSANAFVRFIRLRKAAELFINSDLNVNEVAVQVGINHTKYFREQFHKLFGINPSDYIKKYRKPFKNQLNLNKAPVKTL